MRPSLSRSDPSARFQSRSLNNQPHDKQWRGVDLTVPVLKFLTFWSRKSAGSTIAAQNGCLATISELALAARAPDKTYHHCVLLGHSFGGLVLENTISHSILDASSNGSRNSSPWDMAVAFNPADSSIGSRQLMSELDYPKARWLPQSRFAFRRNRTCRTVLKS
jgi:hypothetical protein